jgi:DNA-binding NtrC family response regulator
MSETKNEPKIPVLIVDDEESIHRALDRTLRREPYELLHAADAGEAEAILTQRPDVRAVICDHYMPGLPGLEFLLHLRRSRPKVAAILLTAQADIQMAITAINEGRLHRFFTKPWDGDELRTSLRKLLKLEKESPSDRASKVRAEEERLRQVMVPRQDATGAWVIEAPEETSS